MYLDINTHNTIDERYKRLSFVVLLLLAALGQLFKIPGIYTESELLQKASLLVDKVQHHHSCFNLGSA